ncbi:MAG: hypothetical protein AB1796_09510 [Bacillota bacterium]
MNVMLNKEYVEERCRCIEKNIEFTANLINTHVHDDELAAALEESFQEILYCFKGCCYGDTVLKW